MVTKFVWFICDFSLKFGSKIKLESEKMDDVGAVLIELKPNSQDDVNAWQKELNKRKDEALATLKAEGVFIESWFHVAIEGKHYLIAYMRAKDIKEAQRIGRESTFAIDQVHKAFKKTWQKVYPASLLVDLVM